jgi:hypothetical protein
MITQSNINLVTIIVISLGFIFIGGAFFYIHNEPGIYGKNPLFWALGISMASGGGSLLIGILTKHLLPKELLQEMNNIKSNKP